MLKDRLMSLFQSYDPAIRRIIYDVSDLEQRYISMKKPRGIRREIDEIVTSVAKQELENSNSNGINGQD